MGKKKRRGGVHDAPPRGHDGRQPAGGLTFAATTGGNRLSRGVLTTELGAPGVVDAATGFTTDPYNPSLAGPAWFRTVDQMLKTSSEAAYIRHLWTLPIQAAQWSIEGQSEELNSLVDTALFQPDGMSTVWDDVLGNAVQCALFGTWAFETVYKEVDGALSLKRLSDRPPATITGYRFAPDRGLKSILNKGVPPGGDEEVEVELPIEKMILLPYRRQGHDYNGQSILRAAYRYWYAIDMLERIANSGIEHSMFGVPVGLAPQGAKDTDIAAFLSLLESIRRHEASGLALPFGWSMADGSKFGGTDAVGCQEWIRWLANRFLRACLAEVGALGDTSAGSFALSDTKVGLLMTCLHGLAGFIAAIFNRHLVSRLIALNAPTAKGDDIPTLIHSRVGHDLQLAALGEFLTALLSGQVIKPGEDDEDFFRNLLGLPEVDRDAVPPAPTPPSDSPSESTLSSPSAGVSKGLTTGPGGEVSPAGEGRNGSTPAGKSSRGFAATATGDQTFAMVTPGDRAAAVAAVRADMTEARDEWGQRGSGFALEMLGDLLDQAAAGAAGLAVSPRIVDAYGRWIADWLTRLYDVAAQQMESELGRTVDVAPPVDQLDRRRRSWPGTTPRASPSRSRRQCSTASRPTRSATASPRRCAGRWRRWPAPRAPPPPTGPTPPSTRRRSRGSRWRWSRQPGRSRSPVIYW